MYAQTKLYIEQKENPKFFIPLSEIRRLTFSDTDLVLHPKGEDVQSFSLIDLTRLHFKDVLASLSTSPYTTQEINVYPNPASQIVNIEYELSIPQNVNIQICLSKLDIVPIIKSAVTSSPSSCAISNVSCNSFLKSLKSSKI